MKPLNEEISRLKEIMGLEEGSNEPTNKGPEGYDDSCDCYPDKVVEVELDDGADSPPSSSSSNSTSTTSSG